MNQDTMQENEFGIRHENLVVCKKAEKTAYGQFMKFEPLTLVPFDLEGIDPNRWKPESAHCSTSIMPLYMRKFLRIWMRMKKAG